MGRIKRKKGMRFPPSLQIRRQLLRCIMQGQFEIDKPLPTIQTLAETFGVSTATVQKAIHLLSADGILDAKPKVGCVVRSVGPRSNRCRTIGVISPHGMNYMKGNASAGSVVGAAQRELAKSGYKVKLIPLADANTYNLVPELQKYKLGGLLLFELDLDFLILEVQELRLHTVSMDYDATRLGVPSVTYDNVFGTFLATKHLIQLGHRRIVFMRPLLSALFKNVVDAPEEERALGYRLAMQEHNLPVRLAERHPQDPVKRHVATVLSGRNRPTALVTAADRYARNICPHMEAMGLKIPGDISITGFGTGPSRRRDVKRLTSVRVDPKEMGRRAARMLLARIHGKGSRRENVALPVELVDAGTTGRP